MGGYLSTYYYGSTDAISEMPVLGYHKIRGLAAPLRMMFYFKQKSFVNKAYAEDLKTAWFAGDKPTLKEKNSLINLPYLIDGETVVTQSNSCLVYLGQKLGIDTPEHAVKNHQAIDQIMDLRNDLMKIVYPGGKCASKQAFPEAFSAHVAQAHFAKLEGFVSGPFICGAEPQSADFHLFEMLDQHMIIIQDIKCDYDMSQFPRLLALHAAMKALPTLAPYFASDMYAYAHNNAMFTFYLGPAYGDGPYGTMVEEEIKF